MNNPVEKNNLISIQWLRAIAVIFVVAWHIMVKADILNIVQNQYFFIGNSGVDLFFVISGFIMAYTAPAKASGFEFIVKRIIRILPLYWLISIIALFVYLYNPSMVNSNAPHTTIINSFTLFPIENHAMLVDVGWTLRYEFLFYLILSISFIFGSRNGLVICTSLMLVLPALGCLFEAKSFYSTILTNPLMIEFSLGIIAFYIHSKKSDICNPIVMILLGLISIAVMEYYTPFINRAFKYGIPMFFILIGLTHVKVENKNPAFIPLSIIGNASYSIYLTHMFSIGASILLFKKTIAGTECSLLFIPISMSISIFAGVLCYYYVEKPLLQLSKRLLHAYCYTDGSFKRKSVITRNDTTP